MQLIVTGICTFVNVKHERVFLRVFNNLRFTVTQRKGIVCKPQFSSICVARGSFTEIDHFLIKHFQRSNVETYAFTLLLHTYTGVCVLESVRIGDDLQENVITVQEVGQICVTSVIGHDLHKIKRRNAALELNASRTRFQVKTDE